MNFLVDHQLPVSLVHWLKSQGHQAEHVRDIGLKNEMDDTIWKHAVSNSLVVISKDEDFVFFAQRDKPHGMLVWVRLGNCRNQHLIQVFTNELPAIVDLFTEGANIVELR